MKILVSGSHGLVGRALIKSVTAYGIEVSRLVRQKPTGAIGEIEWHPDEGVLDAKQLEGLDAVVHLAGESIASGRWSDDKKRAIRESRVKGTQLLSRSLAQLSQPPATFISASAIGYYGNRGNELLTEESAPGTDFLASVCMEWEKSTAAAAEKGIRTVNTRFGIILDASGGALEKMLTPFRMGIGGRVGNGKQWMSWISLDDVVAGLRFVLDNSSASGPVNFVAPNPVTNAEFTKALGRALSRPTFFPIPKIGVQLAFGEMADALLLSSQRVEPRVLKESGYRFQLPTLRDALSHILK
jgi:uncharacterized protein (TIGR01777 family)